MVVALEIDGPSLKFEERNGRFVESIEVSIVAADERARVQGGDRQTFNLNLVPETHERVSRTGVRLLSQLDLPPGRYQIRVGAHEVDGARDRDGAVRPGGARLCQDAVCPERRAAHLVGGRIVRDRESGVRVERPASVAACRDADVRARRHSLTWFAEVYDNSSQVGSRDQLHDDGAGREGRTHARRRRATTEP